MPELPEMENYKNLLMQKIAGSVISNVQVNREKSINVLPEILIQNVQGSKVISVQRRAKHLLFLLDNGHVLLLHLMLGGWMFFGKEADKPNRTIQIQLTFGLEHLFFIGLRLGYLHFYESKEEVNKELADLGPEPLERNFTFEVFRSLTENKRGRLKTKLVDQKFISGIGNCYSDEICFQAKVLPTRSIEEINTSEMNLLYQSTQQVLKEATSYGGYLENPFYKGDTLTGGYNEKCKVYDRVGENCIRCGTKIIKEMIASRKTFYCPNCQK
ncbi:bifunctional DNA-formamidopyrimidine glycosylase/DNA-(apurinic or apyrimidinic site) lyase [Bacillus sp. CGMCC 1.16607]|uniref:bifunctional DNA-formamidopyrimidine glycosylase/DNA-(apurinic or apyrimidinic site) lyase n=1 Tax=Bacillus sp. CGMCC 1.16607 TaxID=3351842 RepID=UPI00362C053A